MVCATWCSSVNIGAEKTYREREAGKAVVEIVEYERSCLCSRKAKNASKNTITTASGEFRVRKQPTYYA